MLFDVAVVYNTFLRYDNSEITIELMKNKKWNGKVAIPNFHNIKQIH